MAGTVKDLIRQIKFPQSFRTARVFLFVGLILDKIIKANVFEIILSKDKKQLSINELCDGAFETILTKEEAIKMVAEISQEYINQMSE